MKPAILSLILLFSATNFAAPHRPVQSQTKKAVVKESACAEAKATTGETYVYICTGSSSTRYHARSNCRGLGGCKATISKVTLQDAEKKGRTPCKICFGD